MEASVGGYPWLPRMIDKARAAQAGTLGDYYRYPCPIDAACLGLLGIDSDTFREIAEHAADDQGVVDGLASIGAEARRLAEFDPVRLNAEFHQADS